MTSINQLGEPLCPACVGYNIRRARIAKGRTLAELAAYMAKSKGTNLSAELAGLEWMENTAEHRFPSMQHPLARGSAG